VDPVDPRDARIAELERLLTLALEQVRVLTARVAELERRLGEQGSGKPPASPTSSKPKAEPSGRKPGGQPGHKGHRRELLPPTSVTECMPSSCRGCGEKLPPTPDENPLRHQVVDLPPIKPNVDEFRLHRVTCE
jgi:transposase